MFNYTHANPEVAMSLLKDFGAFCLIVILTVPFAALLESSTCSDWKKKYFDSLKSMSATGLFVIMLGAVVALGLYFIINQLNQ